MFQQDQQSVSCVAEALESRIFLASTPWGAFPQLIKQVDALVRYPQLTGAGQAVAVIDTGVDYRLPELGGGFGAGHKVLAGYDFVDDDPDPMDLEGHGTAVASVIAADDYYYRGSRYRGLAPKAKIIALRADSGSDEDVTNARVEQALQWVLANRARYNIVAVNLTVGSGAYTNQTTQGPFSDELSALADAGVFIAAASGNSGVTSPPTIEYPAAHPDVYAIGSVNARDLISRFTDRSKDLDLLAPGEDVPLPYYDPKRQRGVIIAASGTSFASPYASAAAALLKQAKPSLTPAQIMRILRDSGSSNRDGDGEVGATTGLTYKRLNIFAAITMALQNGSGSGGGTGGGSKQPPLASPLAISAAYDKRGTLHVAYQDAISHTLKYMTRSAGGDWSAVQTVDSSSDVGRDVSLALTKSGRPVVAYYDAPNTNLKVAWWAGSGFQSTTLDSNGDTGEFPSMLYAGGSVPWITYYRRSSGDLYVATIWKKKWYTGPLDTAGDVGRYSSIAVNPRTRKLAVAFADDTRGEVRYLEQGRGGWKAASMDRLDAGARYISLGFNSTGLPAISYEDYAADNLKLARRDAAGKWSTQLINSDGSQGAYSKVMFNGGSDRPDIYYLNQTEEAVYRATFVGNQWQFSRQGEGGYYLTAAQSSNGEKTLLWRNPRTGRMEVKVFR